MKCKICNSDSVTRKTEETTRTFRKENFKVFEQYYHCSNCGNEYTTDELDNLVLQQVHNQYREKYSIPFPKQLVAIRKKYDINSKAMSELLGFGPNQYRLYENGEIPSESNGTLLNLILDPEEFRRILISKKNHLKSDHFEKYLKRADKVIKENSDAWFDLKKIFFNTNKIPDRFSGYSVPSLQKFANMVIFFLDNAFYQVRLNKFLFYADFYHFKQTGYSISGMQYAAIPMGPVPDNYYELFGILKNENIIYPELQYTNNDAYEKFVKSRDFDEAIFSDDEISAMRKVLQEFQWETTKDIVEISHKEKAWTENHQSKSPISYLDYAFEIKAI